MKFGQFMSYYKKKNIYQNIMQKLQPEKQPGTFVFAKN